MVPLQALLLFFVFLDHSSLRVTGWIQILPRRSGLHTHFVLPRKRPIRPTASNKAAELKYNATLVSGSNLTVHQRALQDPSLLSDTGFEDLSPESRRALQELGYQNMTTIQNETWTSARVMGKSVLGQAPTGSGKTLAYLLPVIERLVAGNVPEYRRQRTIGAIVIAPTRELAQQIQVQADGLLRYHKDCVAHCVHGGTKMRGDRKKIETCPTILVATPGRINDHLRETRIGSKRFVDFLASTQILVLDEVDVLLEAYSREIDSLLTALPRSSQRQTLLFSATLPKRLDNRYLKLLPEDYVRLGERILPNARVVQEYTYLPSMSQYFVGLVQILEQAFVEEPDARVLVFLPTVRLVNFFADLVQEQTTVKVLRVHSRMSQASRERMSSEFRKSGRAVLLSSDVSARGVDYPAVSLVIQYGAPPKYKTYIHRIGRVGRAGAGGRSLLCLLPVDSIHHNQYIQSRSVREIGWQRFAVCPGSDFLTSIGKGGEPRRSSAISAIVSIAAFYENLGVGSFLLRDSLSELGVSLGLNEDVTTFLPEVLAGKLL